METRSTYERLEELAKEFAKDTGLLAPFKDAPAAASNDPHYNQEHRRQEWDTWLKCRQAHATLPTQEQIRTLWEWCGWKRIPFGKHNFHYERDEKAMDWLAPDSDRSSTHLPDLDLNNLFKWAVPKVDEHGAGACEWVLGRFCQAVYEHKDLDLALFWAIWKIITAEASCGVTTEEEI